MEETKVKKSKMNFDFLEYSKDNLERVRLTSGEKEQITAVCPFCGKWGGFYVDMETGNYICFKCERRGLNFVGVIAEVEGISWHEARGFMVRKLVQFRRRETQKSLLKKIKALREEEEPEDTKKVEIDLPEEFIPVWKNGKWNFPVYLHERGVKKATAKKWGLGFCKKGKFGGRIIFPVRCPNGYSFTARDATGIQQPKILDPEGEGKSKLLLGWEHLKKNSDLIICEGPFDVIKLSQFGFSALALLGKNLSASQLSLLLKLPSKISVVIMLDPEEVEKAYEIAFQLFCLFDGIQIAKLNANTDPGSASKKEIFSAYLEAEHFDGQKSGKIASLLAKSQKKISEVYK